jgi:hypothetical protein
MSTCLENWLVALVVFGTVYEAGRAEHWCGWIAVSLAVWLALEVIQQPQTNG